ncbi:MAG: class I SAM-dependent RNA methyltransferase [Anaerolineales bacterium]
MNSSREFEVLPTTFVYGGDVLARLPDGRAVFIPYALPDEKVRIRLVEEKERFARGEIVEILEPSPKRIEARCPHFQECGGCHYQHLPYQDQLLLKEKIMVDQFTRVGKLENPPVQPVRPSPAPWNYRNHIQFHISEDGQPGYLKGHSNEIIPIQECHLPEESLNEIWPSFNFEHIPGLDRVSLRSGEDGEDTLLVLESTSEESFEFSVDLPLSAVLLEPDQEIILAGDDFTVMPILGFPFVVSAGSFFQTNTAVAELLVEALLEKLPLSEESLVLDVYCGVGLFSVFLAQRVKKVIGIESSPGAAEDFLYNLADFENVELYDISAEEVLPMLAVEPDIILLDPPRAGLSKEVLDQVVAMEPPVIAYISCDPATLARDAQRLQKGGYKLLESTPFDMFPQTYHIESLNIFQRA